jgi:hypothetical protein
MILPLLLLGCAQAPQDDRIDRLEAELAALRLEMARERAAERAEREAQVAAMSAALDDAKRESDVSAALDRFSFGGYGELHYNNPEGSGGSQADIHRWVFYLGYRFSDSIQLHSETEFEHGYVEDGNGELVVEQLYLDFAVGAATHIQAGRMLAPLGIVNQHHEPPSFNGVERPLMETLVLPSTWYLDGVGVVGEFNPALRYQAFLTGSLDGTGFSSDQGIRGGRQQERPGLNEPALSGRLDFYPLESAHGGMAGQELRLGLAGFFGGLNNGNQGNDPGVNGEISILSADAQWSIGRLDLRGVGAFEWIDNADELSAATGETIASQISGWYLEAAWHWMPERWKTGPRGWSDAIAFVRYDDVDTQRQTPLGLPSDPAGDRNQWTVGVGLFPLSNLVIKADYQINDDDSSSSPANQFNLGLGWSF